MISLAQIKAKAKRIWDDYHLQRSCLMGETIFPLNFDLPKLSASQLQHDYLQVRAWIKELLEQSKIHLGFGYEVIFKEINHRQLGQQSFPHYIVFHQPSDFLQFINKTKEFENFQQLAADLVQREPLLKPWLCRYPENILDYKKEWPRFFAICDFLRNNPQINLYIRQLDIPGVDTKFIEQHKPILIELLDQLLPATAINTEITQRGAHYFEQRYGFKFDEKLIRFRLLDPDLQQSNRSDLSVQLNNFINHPINCQHIFITENKINGLSFPPVKNSIVIFGLGYGIQSLRNVAWFKNKTITYWGDIDTHGFAMLSQLRSYYPQTISFLMDSLTLTKFQNLWVTELPNKRCSAQLSYLTFEEQRLYQDLLNNVFGENIRLEQERIGFNYFLQQLDHYLTEANKVEV